MCCDTSGGSSPAFDVFAGGAPDRVTATTPVAVATAATTSPIRTCRYRRVTFYLLTKTAYDGVG
jgi:hypothetical protein